MTEPKPTSSSAPQAGGDETPVAWTRRSELEKLRSMLPGYARAIWAARTDFIEGGEPADVPLFTRPTPAAAAEVPSLTLEEIMAMRTAARNDPRCEDELWFVLMARMIEARYAASPVAPAGVPSLIDELHRDIMNLPCKRYDGTTTYDAYCKGHRDARHAAAELVSAVLSAGAPAVPLQPDSAHSIADGGQAPSAGLTSQPVGGNTAAPTEVDAPQERETVTLPRVASEAMLRAFYECPPDELPLAWQALVYVGERELRRPVLCDGRDGVTGSAASSEAREAISSSSGTDGHGKDCA